LSERRQNKEYVKIETVHTLPDGRVSAFMKNQELEKFYNRGFGWICRDCESKFKTDEPEKQSRLMTEGEAESKQPVFSNKALAKWSDDEQKTLVCPSCRIKEKIEK
jgi:hypothetical protein